MKSVIVDERISEGCKRGLLRHGFMPLPLPKDPSLGDAVTSHPDTVLLKVSDDIFTTADYCDTAAYFFSDIRESHPNAVIHFTSDVRGATYPDDCSMNALVMGARVFARLDSLSQAVKEHLRARGYGLVNTKQGYPACTVLALGDSAAITADRGMAKLLAENGIRVTLICEGGISLPPHEYGFIGGASGVYQGKVYFLGSLDTHPDALLIKNTIINEGFEPISLSDEPLFDGGGLIFLE